MRPKRAAPTGASAATGAVNHEGQLFDGKGGVHPGLYVANVAAAAVLPHSLAAPPLVIITALAERNLRRFVSRELPAPCQLKSVFEMIKEGK